MAAKWNEAGEIESGERIRNKKFEDFVPAFCWIFLANRI